MQGRQFQVAKFKNVAQPFTVRTGRANWRSKPVVSHFNFTQSARNFVKPHSSFFGGFTVDQQGPLVFFNGGLIDYHFVHV